MVENGFVCLSANRVPQFQQVMMIFHFPIKIASSAPPPCFWTNPSQVQQAFLQSQESWLLSWLELPGIWKGWTWVFLSVWTCEVVNLNFLLYSLLMSNKKPFTPLSVKSRMSTFDGGADSTRSMLQPNLRAETCETIETTLILQEKWLRVKWSEPRHPCPSCSARCAMTALSPIKENCCCKFFGIEDSAALDSEKENSECLKSWGRRPFTTHISSRNAHTIKHKSEVSLSPGIELIETTTKFELNSSQLTSNCYRMNFRRELCCSSKSPRASMPDTRFES